MIDEEIKAYYERIDKLLNGANKRTYGFAPQEIKNILRSHEILGQENQELKKQLKNCYCNRTDCSSRIKDSKKYDSLVQKVEKHQKEFIEWLEDQLNIYDGFLDAIKSDLEEISYAGRVSGKTYIATQIMKNETAKKCYEEALSKYKEIIGDDNK